MKRKVSAEQARRQIAELLESVQSQGDEVVIERAGKPLAVVIPAARYESLERSREELRALIERVRKANASDDPEDIYADVEAAVDEVRKARAKRTA